ncbi:hypothetical protein HY491_00810 [Candidatus Woesearchaeota archaeon]|nr:hypothetical protein [Candidatus Woesearchaeota archaeon]
METLNILIIGVAVFLVFGLMLQAFQIISLGDGATGNAASSNGQIDMAGWTENERMNYDMHGTIPARLQGKNIQSSPSAGGMVGGC